MPGRVLRVITRLNRGGPLRQLQALVPGLAALGWEGPVLAGLPEPHEPDGTADLVATGAEVVRLESLRRGIDPFTDARALAEIGGWVARIEPDVVHTHLAKAGALGRWAAHRVGVPVVHTFHGHHFTAPWPKGWLAVRAERRLARWTTAAVALSERQRRDLVEVHRVLPADRVHVIGPGIDVDAFRARARKPVARDARPFLLWTGRFVEVKDPLLLVEAVARSKRGFRLAMLGDGPLLPRVRAEVERRGLSAVVELPGPVDDVAPWVAACDAVVLSSRSEGTPISIVEALVLGKRVVSTAVGGVPDLLASPADGTLVPPADAAALAAALDAAHSAPDAPRRGDERFSGTRLAAATAALYEQVLGTQRGG